MGGFNGALAFSTQDGAYNNLPRIPLERMRITQNGFVGIGYTNPGYRLTVNGTISGTTKFFDIADEGKGGSWRLRHGTIESDGLHIQYKRTYECVQGNNYFEQEEWFDWLCEDAVCFTSPVKHFGNSWAELSGRTLQIQTTKAGKYNVLIFATRKDT